MKQNILKLISFRVSGHFAHFRKFYTNASSLSYLIPPRTVIMGMLASVLRYERDSYYTVFCPEKFRISVAVTPGTQIKKKVQSLNYLHPDYFQFLCKGSGKVRGVHGQCKLELLIPESKTINYTIYVGVTKEDSLTLLGDFETRIRQGNLGYGIYFGQRQFKADIDHIQSYPKERIRLIESAGYTDTLCLQENSNPDMTDDRNSDTYIVLDQMPVHMKKEKTMEKQRTKSNSGRVANVVKRVLHEKSGKRIFGEFKNGYQINDKIITFYEG